MKIAILFIEMLSLFPIADARTNSIQLQAQAEYYVAVYAEHFRVPPALVRAIIKQESDWQPCVLSSKGAMGIMQLMPKTAERLGVVDRCNLDRNIAGGIRYLAWLMGVFHDDLRLVIAAYYAGEDVISRRGLAYRNPDVIHYVTSIRNLYVRQSGTDETAEPRRDVQ
jgi:soluble lytic murein transglycosylase-like protein